MNHAVIFLSIEKRSSIATSGTIKRNKDKTPTKRRNSKKVSDCNSHCCPVSVPVPAWSLCLTCCVGLLFLVGPGVDAFHGQPVVHANGDLASGFREGSLRDWRNDVNARDTHAGRVKFKCRRVERGAGNAEATSFGGGEGAKVVQDYYCNERSRRGYSVHVR